MDNLTAGGALMPSPHLHVVPQNDLVAHRVAEDGECVCGPREEFVDTSAVTGWLVIHSSLDGREKTEEP